MIIPLQKLFRWFRRPQLWAPGDCQLHHHNATIHAPHLVQSFLVKHQITQVTQLPYSQDLVPCDLWLFPKLKSPLKGKRFQTIDAIGENTAGQLMAFGRTVRSKVPTLKRTEVSLSYVRWFLYLVSSLINASIFRITWLDTFRTGLIDKGCGDSVTGIPKQRHVDKQVVSKDWCC